MSTTKVVKGPIMQKPFKTAYVRPDRFRFEYSQWILLSQLRWIIWGDGGVVRRWSSTQGWAKPETLAHALAEAAGLSGLSSFMVPTLLLSGPSSPVWTASMTDLDRLEDDGVGTAQCYRVRGRLGECTMTLWIDQQTNLLLRTERQMEKEGLEEIATYQPKVNEAVPDTDLKFVSPADA